MFNFEDLKIIYNNKKVIIKDLINIHGYTYRENFESDNMTLNDYVLKKNNEINLDCNNNTICICFNEKSLTLHSVTFKSCDMNGNNNKSKIHYYDDGSIKEISTKRQLIKYYSNGYIYSINRYGNLLFNNKWVYREFYLSGDLKAETISINETTEYTVVYYINGNKYKEIYQNSYGSKHNLNGPAVLKYDLDGNCYSRSYYLYNNIIEPCNSLAEINEEINNININMKFREFKLSLNILSLKAQELLLQGKIDTTIYEYLINKIDSQNIVRKLSK